MEESTTYQRIVAKGEARGIVKGQQQLLLLQGRKRFGPADEQTTAALEAITDPTQLERLGQRLLEVSSWQELLAEPPT